MQVEWAAHEVSLVVIHHMAVVAAVVLAVLAAIIVVVQVGQALLVLSQDHL
jgi:hypothetical protein